MRITCKRDLLLENLQTVLKTVATKSTMPVLSGIRLEIKESGKLEMASTDMELSLRLTMDAETEDEGAAVAPGRLLTDVVKSLLPGDLTISVDVKEQLMEITSGSASFRLNCLPAGDFPRLAEMPEGETFEVERKPFVETINTVAKAASRDETRPVLTGMLVKFSKNKIKMVATDSYRLSVCETAAQTTLSDKKEIIIPRSSMEELARICGQVRPDVVGIGIIDGQVVFQAGNIFLASRLIEGQFPNYQQLLPEEFKHEIGIDKEELLDVVGRIGLMAQKNAPIRMKFNEGELTVSAQTPQVGDASESLPVAFQGEEVEIGFNPEFFRDGIDSVGEEQVLLRIISPLRPGLLKGAGDDFLYLIMPVRLTG